MTGLRAYLASVLLAALILAATALAVVVLLNPARPVTPLSDGRATSTVPVLPPECVRC